MSLLQHQELDRRGRTNTDGRSTTRQVNLEKYKTNTNGKHPAPVTPLPGVPVLRNESLERRLPLGMGCNLRTKPCSVSATPDPTHSVPLTMLMQSAEQEGRVFQSQDGNITGRLP